MCEARVYRDGKPVAPGVMEMLRGIFRSQPTTRYSLRQLANLLGITEKDDVSGVNARLVKLMQRRFLVKETATIAGRRRMVYRLRLPSDR